MRRIEIVGGGLSGLSLGVALAKRGIPVTLYERSTVRRHRVCGEFICGVTDQTLNLLGIQTAFEGVDRLSSSLWSRSGRFLGRYTLPQSAFGISRWFLDRALADLFEEAGGRLIEHHAFRVPDQPEPGLVRAKGRRAERTGWMGFKAHYQDLPLEADLEVHLGRSSYVGCSRIEEGKVNVCGLFEKSAVAGGHTRDGLEDRLEAVGLSGLAERLRSAHRCQASAAGVAGVDFRIRPYQPGVLSVGDAWAVIPPFTGNGMSMAFESSALALDPIEAYAGGRLDWETACREVYRAQMRAFRTRMRVSRLLHPLIFHPAGQACLGWIARTRLLPFRFLFGLTH